jgi:hypothetical protein
MEKENFIIFKYFKKNLLLHSLVKIGDKAIQMTFCLINLK